MSIEEFFNCTVDQIADLSYAAYTSPIKRAPDLGLHGPDVGAVLKAATFWESGVGSGNVYTCGDDVRYGPWYFNSNSMGTLGRKLTADIVEKHELAREGKLHCISSAIFDSIALGIYKVELLGSGILSCSCIRKSRVGYCSHILAVAEFTQTNGGYLAASLAKEASALTFSSRKGSGRKTKTKGHRHKQNSPEKSSIFLQFSPCGLARSTTRPPELRAAMNPALEAELKNSNTLEQNKQIAFNAILFATSREKGTKGASAVEWCKERGLIAEYEEFRKSISSKWIAKSKRVHSSTVVHSETNSNTKPAQRRKIPHVHAKASTSGSQRPRVIGNFAPQNLNFGKTSKQNPSTPEPQFAKHPKTLAPQNLNPHRHPESTRHSSRIDSRKSARTSESALSQEEEQSDRHLMETEPAAKSSEAGTKTADADPESRGFLSADCDFSRGMSAMQRPARSPEVLTAEDNPHMGVGAVQPNIASFIRKICYMQVRVMWDGQCLFRSIGKIKNMHPGAVMSEVESALSDTSSVHAQVTSEERGLIIAKCKRYAQVKENHWEKTPDWSGSDEIKILAVHWNQPIVVFNMHPDYAHMQYPITMHSAHPTTPTESTKGEPADICNLEGWVQREVQAANDRAAEQTEEAPPESQGKVPERRSAAARDAEVQPIYLLFNGVHYNAAVPRTCLCAGEAECACMPGILEQDIRPGVVPANSASGQRQLHIN